MELLQRPPGDVFAPPGRIAELIGRVAARRGLDEIPVGCFYTFDFRTRLLPFLFYDSRMVPAGLRAVAVAFHACGFTRTRAVFQLWSPNVRPSACRIDGRPLGVLATSAMQIHSQPSYDLITDAWSMGADRPLILAGGPKAIYEPDHYFGLGPDGDLHADAVATGEELVLLELLDRITAHRGGGETMLAAFQRCRDEGLLEDIPGLVYASRERDRDGRPVLIDTGAQRLVRDLDELPHPRVGFTLIEPPHKRRTLSPRPVPEGEIHKYSRVAALVTTHGCRFGCRYCPIPGFNQKTWRSKSPARLADEFKVLREQLNIRFFFGTDDNFFNDRRTAEEIFTLLARQHYVSPDKTRKPMRAVRFSTEATELDVWRHRDLIPLAREAGTWAIWFGIEDLSADLINKGQTPEMTVDLFRLLNAYHVLPMVMMMYHDAQPLRTSGGDMRGLVNQARFLFDNGAASYQCTLHSPSIGAREYEGTFNSGTVIQTAGGERLPDAYYDGNHVLASSAPDPARIQRNLFRGYAAFYNPINLVRAFFRDQERDPLHLRRAFVQALGMTSLAITMAKGFGWLRKLGSGRMTYWPGPPARKFTVRRLAERPAPPAAVAS